MPDTLPLHYFYFFWLLEPGLSVAGAFYAVLWPEDYAADLLPSTTERITNIVGRTVRGQMVVGQLGSLFLLLAMISFSLFPLFKWQLGSQPAIQEKLVRGLLVPLIILTLLPLPNELRWAPAQWTQLIHGNVDVTVLLIIWRTAWFLGIGRYVPGAEKAEAESAEQAEAEKAAAATPVKRGRGRPRKVTAEKDE
ncbi:uncharacterized protein LOC62_03G003713 [Vanrija pseudolonga]|uniref:DUF7704 domain-containing protein n=1 Tax=Vanrija pseudolonga TaxID=143232 RepID=A0AAF1BHG2_9TREE|nr:hypothetical protein LOC62_03G003713 [Vanrija pseudolonga]